MRVCFYASDKPRERELAEAVLAGAQVHGAEGFVKPLTPQIEVEACDVACMIGVKSIHLFRAIQAAGILPIYFDKGYVRSRRAESRTWEFWRVSVGAHHPTHTTLMRHKKPSDRWEALGIELKPWRRRGLQIVFAGSSAKYHEFYRLSEPTRFARKVIANIASLSDRPVIYRPKPSWRDAVPIKGARYSGGDEGITAALANAHCLVTHGSNACFEAALLGIPSIILGDAVAWPISSTSLAEVEAPRISKRERWLHNLAYHQWTLDEFRSGEAWGTMGEWINEQRP